MISVNNQTAYKLDQNVIHHYITLILQKLTMKNWCVELTFCSQEYSQQINNHYLSHNYPTDVITFDLSDSKEKLMDVYICIDIAKQNCDTFDEKLDMELKRLIIHACLHVIGYNDQNPEEKKVMFEKQEHLLNENISTSFFTS